VRSTPEGNQAKSFDLGVDSKTETSTAGIPEAGSQTTLSLGSSLPEDARPFPRRPKNWLEIPARVWREEMRGEPPWKQLAQACADIWSDPRLEAQLRYYLRTTEPRFVSIAHWRRCFGRWETPGRNLLPSSHAKFVPDNFPTQPIDVARLRALAGQ